MVVRRRRLNEIRRAIFEHAPESFVSVEWTDRPTSHGPLGPTQRGVFGRRRLGK
jgi:hypothetical protein